MPRAPENMASKTQAAIDIHDPLRMDLRDTPNVFYVLRKKTNRRAKPGK
jgi:hypothetical protein